MTPSDSLTDFAFEVARRAVDARTRAEVDRLVEEVAMRVCAEVCVGLHLRDTREGLWLQVTFGCAPRAWRETYCGAGHLKADPLVGHVFQHHEAASWKDVSSADLHLPQARAALAAAADLDLHEALIAPQNRTPAAVAAILFVGADLGLSDQRRRHDILGIASSLQRAADRLGLGGGRRGRSLLTGRETQVAYWVALELSDKEAALQLGVAPHSVSRHLRAIQRKLGASGRLGTVSRATELGLLPVWMPHRSRAKA